MRRREPVSTKFSHEAPPPEILRFKPAAPSPIGPHGRPEPWQVEWRPEEFAAFLRARVAWRDTHALPLPSLPARERAAMQQLGIPQALIDVETTASSGERPPSYRPQAVVDTRPVAPLHFSTSEEGEAQ